MADECLVDEKPAKSLKMLELKDWLHRKGYRKGIKTTGKKADLILRYHK